MNTERMYVPVITLFLAIGSIPFLFMEMLFGCLTSGPAFLSVCRIEQWSGAIGLALIAVYLVFSIVFAFTRNKKDLIRSSKACLYTLIALFLLIALIKMIK